jgi:hypothetical protein
VTTLAARNTAVTAADRPRTGGNPFVVTGILHGRAQRVAVSSLPDVLALIGRWTAEDPDATGAWALNEDYSAPVNLVARVRAGLIGERGRVAHVFSLVPGVSQGCRLTTCCGEQLSILDLEWLSLGEGMPCECCLRAAGATTPAPAPARPISTPRPRGLLGSRSPRLAY